MKHLLLAVAACAALATAASGAEREVSVPTGKGEIHGALRTPDGGAKGPAVLIIAGSGPTDRNGDSTVPGVKPASYRLLADALEAAGISSLRYDKRGQGASARALVGDQALNNANAYAAEAELRFTDFADDAAAFARFLAAQPGVSCVVILGHSEGSLLGMLAAQKVPVCGYVSVSGIGRNAADVLTEQIAASGGSAEDMARLAAVLAKLKAGETVPDAPFPALFRPSVQPYMISWLRYDPAVEITRIKAPVLIVQGDNDIQVAVKDAQLLARARPDATLAIIPGMNHVLKIAPTDRAGNAATYADPARPLAPAFVSAVVGFVKGLGARH